MPKMLHRVTVRVMNALDFNVKMSPYRQRSLLSHTDNSICMQTFSALIGK